MSASPFTITPEQGAAIAAAEARLSAERTPAPPPPEQTMCETHDVAGACDTGCVDLVNAMSGGYAGESMVYGNYLGGTSSIDVSGCHAGPVGPRTVAVLDAERRAVAWATEHPGGCDCAAPACPETIRADAYAEVMGDTSGQVWEMGPEGWVRAPEHDLHPR